MARRKELVYFEGAYRGSLLEEEDCRKLDVILRLHEDNGSLPDLERCITYLSEDEIEQVKQTGLPISNPEQGYLRDYQTVSVAFSLIAKRCLLGASVGLGKTVILCGLVNKLLEKKEGLSCLFLGEKNSLSEMQEKLIQFTNLPWKITTGEAAKVTKVLKENPLGEGLMLVASHSLLTQNKFYNAVKEFREKEKRNPFDVIIIDEQSDIDSKTSSFGGEGTQKFKNLAWLSSDAEYVIGLNATPFEANLITFFQQINLLDPTLLPAKTSVLNRYAVMAYQGRPWKEPTGKYQNTEEFRRLIRYRYLPQTRKGLGAKFQNCTAELLTTPLTKVQKELLKKTSMPQMVYDCPWYFDPSLPVNADSTGKLAKLEKVVLDVLADYPSLLIYCHYKESQQALKNYLYDLGYDSFILNGDLDFDLKNRIIKSFKRGDVPILITNVYKSLDFDNCDNVLFYSAIGNPNKMVQFEGRMTRDLDIINKHVYVIACEGAELKKFRTVIADRAKASNEFAGSDYSMVLDLIAAKSKEKELEENSASSVQDENIFVWDEADV